MSNVDLNESSPLEFHNARIPGVDLAYVYYSVEKHQNNPCSFACEYQPNAKTV